jgi:maltose-binding protein MalE
MDREVVSPIWYILWSFGKFIYGYGILYQEKYGNYVFDLPNPMSVLTVM